MQAECHRLPVDQAYFVAGITNRAELSRSVWIMRRLSLPVRMGSRCSA